MYCYFMQNTQLALKYLHTKQKQLLSIKLNATYRDKIQPAKNIKYVCGLMLAAL